jgi:sugar phosphate isomerase/epimerase
MKGTVKMILGAQLYTLRDFAKTPDMLAQTLARVADIGYTTVQVSGTCEYESEWLDEKLKENGLKCALTHFNAGKIKENTEETVAFHNVFGCKNIGVGSVPGGLKNDDDYNRFVSEFLPVSKKIASLGSSFMIHNHFYEFVRSGDGKLYIDKMAEDFAPEELGFIIDTYWVQYSGGDPAYWIRKLAGRVKCIHLKDMEYTDTQRMAAVGSGNMNFNSILSACAVAGSEYLIVEQDECYGADPFECLRKSYKYLNSLGLN